MHKHVLQCIPSLVYSHQRLCTFSHTHIAYMYTMTCRYGKCALLEGATQVTNLSIWFVLEEATVISSTCQPPCSGPIIKPARGPTSGPIEPGHTQSAVVHTEEPWSTCFAMWHRCKKACSPRKQTSSTAPVWKRCLITGLPFCTLSRAQLAPAFLSATCMQSVPSSCLHP